MSFHIFYYHITNSALSVLVLVHITSRSGVQIVIKQTDSYDSVFFPDHLLSVFAASDELSHQLMCIGKCHWWVYSSFSTCDSAIRRRHSR